MKILFHQPAQEQMELGAFMGYRDSPRYPSRAPPIRQYIDRWSLAATVHVAPAPLVSLAQTDPRSALTEGQGYGDKNHFG
jgi:hypothetical protein